jgi:hypothetical protein
MSGGEKSGEKCVNPIKDKHKDMVTYWGYSEYEVEKWMRTHSHMPITLGSCIQYQLNSNKIITLDTEKSDEEFFANLEPSMNLCQQRIKSNQLFPPTIEVEELCLGPEGSASVYSVATVDPAIKYWSTDLPIVGTDKEFPPPTNG